LGGGLPRRVHRHEPPRLGRRAPRRGAGGGRHRGRRLHRQGGAGRLLLRAHEAAHGGARRGRRRAGGGSAGRGPPGHVLGSAGSASELFLRQVRGGCP
jgi:hypothetical protein